MDENAQTSQDFGAIWINGEGDSTTLRIGFEGNYYTGKKNTRKTDEASSAPDYLITNDQGEEVGAAWRGMTGTNREKLRIKLNNEYLTAVMRDEVRGKQGDMFIYPPDRSKTN